MNKQMSAQQVVAGLKDGMTIGIGGWGPRRKPMALIREILRSDLKDLTIVAYGGADVGMLCAAGKVKKVVFAFVSLDFIPLEPYFRQARQGGVLEVMEIDEGMMLLGLRAASWGVPFIPTEVGLGIQPISQALQEYPEMTETFAEIHSKLGILLTNEEGPRLQMFGRLGYGPDLDETPRWKIETRLI